MDNMEFSSISVGKPFPPAVGRVEGAQMHINPKLGDDTIQFISNFTKPTYSEIQDYRNGKIKIRLFMENDTLFFLFKIGNQDWCDVPFEPRLYDSFVIEDVGDSKGYPILMILTDAPSGIVKHLRLISVSTDFSRIFKKTVDYLNEKREGFTKEEYLNKLDGIQKKYTTTQMAKKAIVGFELS